MIVASLLITPTEHESEILRFHPFRLVLVLAFGQNRVPSRRLLSFSYLVFSYCFHSTSFGYVDTMTTDGRMSFLASQGAILVSTERESTSGVQIVFQSSGGDASRSASPIADFNARQVIPTTVGYQGTVSRPRPRFHVELREGESTVVSWKELVKNSQDNAITFSCETSATVDPSHVAPPTKAATSAHVFQDPANRFSAVIASIGRGIERLHQGVDSEKEDEYVTTDDYYDTMDSFIDDTELDEYFQVDTIKPKHTGFFVQKRTMKKVEEFPPCPPLQPLPPVHLEKKRKQSNIAKHSREMGEISKEKVKDLSLGLTDANCETPRSVSSVDLKKTGSILVKCCKQSLIPKPKKRSKSVGSSTGSILVKTCEQSVTSKPKKRVKSGLSKRDSHAENTTMLSSDFMSTGENVRELKGEQAKDVRLQDMELETTSLVNSGVVPCRAVDAEQLDGSSNDLQETLGSIYNGQLDSHGIQNAVQNAVSSAKERREKQNTVKMGEQNFRKNDDSITKKHKTDRETGAMGRKLPDPSRASKKETKNGEDG